jgi:TonB-linked SusC/RagA family outer membrane protein
VGYNTYSYRLNLDLNITPTTIAYFGSSGFLSIHKEPGLVNTDRIWEMSRELNPLILPAKYSTGEIPTGSDTQISPYTYVNYMGHRSSQEFKGQATLRLEQDMEFVTPGLKFSIQGSYDITSQFNESRTVIPYMYRADQRDSKGELVLTEVVRGTQPLYGYSKNQYRKYYLKSTVNWSRAFGDHRISALFNYEMEDNKWANDADNENMGANANLRSIPKRYLSYAGWANYSYRDTYLFDVNLGYTGSENFQPGKQFGWFPAIGLGWVPTNYDMVKNALPFLSYLKIRGTLGSVGNDRISARRFPYLTIVNTGGAHPFGSSTSVYTLGESLTGADNLDWEKSLKTDVGFEMRLLNDKLEIIYSFFRDKRTGIFQERHLIPRYAGLINNPFGNVGEMESFGSDGTVKFEQELTKNSTLTIRGNYTYSNNTVINWEEAYPKYSYQELTGLPNGYRRGLKSLGFFRDETDVLTSPVQNWGAVLPGDLKYMDVNGDGKINDDDRVPLSDSHMPLVMFGFGGEYRYKNFTAGIMFRGTGKSYYYIVGGDGGEGMGYIPFRNREYGNILTIAADPANRWIPRSYAEANGIDAALAENPNAEFPLLTYGDNQNNRQLSDFWKRDGRYFRLQEITLNYNWKSDFLKKIRISSVDLQLIGTNLGVWGKTKIFDPEQARFNGGKYPLPAVYSFQVYINL